MKNILLKQTGAVALVCLLLACTPCPKMEPQITYYVTEKRIQNLETPFKPLTKDEMSLLWGKELYLGVRFADEADFYRAITAFKSALFLIPSREKERKTQIEYYLVLSYYLAGKQKEALENFEQSSLLFVDKSFPAYRELLISLYDIYDTLNFIEKKTLIGEKIRANFPDEYNKLELSEAFLSADFPALQASESNDVQEFLARYECQKLSPSKASLLQAVLPGAGYYYVGLKNAAFTSFVLNTLFIAGTYQLFHKGYPALALFTLSLEAGWYFGGINGAQIAAVEFNERLYENLGKETMMKEKLFPVLMFQYAF